MFFLVVTAVISVLFGITMFKRSSSPVMKSLEKKHVVITGGSSGIGLAMAKEVLLQGGFVTLISRSAANLEGAAEKLVKDLSCNPDKIFSKAADVSNYRAISQAIQEAFQWRPIDVLICNAGLTRGGNLETQTVEDMNLTMHTNFNGTVYTVHAALPLLKMHSKEHHVSIVLVGSLASMFFFYGHSVYTAAKHAVKGFAESLKFELMPYDIHVSLACPGFVDTAFLDEVENDKENIKLLKIMNFYDRGSAEKPTGVAKIILEGAKKGTYLITTKINYPGLFVSTVARGFVPAETVGRFLVEMFLYFPFRALSVLAMSDFRKEVRNHFSRNQVSK
uniref:3-dehydrosphinganine reductase n=1 Tax=Araucaria cunninghamii TaxID=56994 RepID=A0A0D6QYP9_ARACU